MDWKGVGNDMRKTKHKKRTRHITDRNTTKIKIKQKRKIKGATQYLSDKDRKTEFFVICGDCGGLGEFVSFGKKSDREDIIY